MTTAIACPSCQRDVSSKAFDCPNCGHPLRKPRRGFFGTLFKWLFIAFNLIMVLWLGSYLAGLGEMTADLTSDAERAGAAIGGTLAVSFLLGLWAIGDVILGLLVLLTRPAK